MRLGEIKFLSRKLSKDHDLQVGSGGKLLVIYIPGGKNKIKNLSLVFDDKMKLT